MDTSIQSLVTEGVRISVRTIYVPEQSSVKNNTFVFAYRITIVNETDQTVQLLRRHWVIKDAQGELREVKGDGVVGQQPVLLPGRSHSYVSGCVLKTPIGTMDGFYTMIRYEDEAEFDVKIPEFTLTAAFLLN
jgi:ApaG protein